MSTTTKIGGYDAMILKVGYIFAEEVPTDIWAVAAYHEVDGSRLINVENAISMLEDSDEPLSESEQALLQICKEAETEGIGDIVINPP